MLLVGLGPVYDQLLVSVGLGSFPVNSLVAVGLDRFTSELFISVGLGSFPINPLVAVGLDLFTSQLLVSVGLGSFPVNPLSTGWPQTGLPVSSSSQLAWAHPSQPPPYHLASIRFTSQLLVSVGLGSSQSTPPLLVGLNRFTSQLLSSVGLGQLHLHC